MVFSAFSLHSGVTPCFASDLSSQRCVGREKDLFLLCFVKQPFLFIYDELLSFQGLEHPPLQPVCCSGSLEQVLIQAHPLHSPWVSEPYCHKP